MYTPETSGLKGNFVYMKNTCIKHSSEVIRFEILLWFFGCKKRKVIPFGADIYTYIAHIREYPWDLEALLKINT